MIAFSDAWIGTGIGSSYPVTTGYSHSVAHLQLCEEDLVGVLRGHQPTTAPAVHLARVRTCAREARRRELGPAALLRLLPRAHHLIRGGVARRRERAGRGAVPRTCGLSAAKFS